MPHVMERTTTRPLASPGTWRAVRMLGRRGPGVTPARWWAPTPAAYVPGVLVAAFASVGFESFTGAAQWAAAASSHELLLALAAAPDPLTGAPSSRPARPPCPGWRPASTRTRSRRRWPPGPAAHLHRPGEKGHGRLAVALDGKTVRRRVRFDCTRQERRGLAAA